MFKPCASSWAKVLGKSRRSSGAWPTKSLISSVNRRSGSSTKRPSPRRASIRWVWGGHTAARWARGATARAICPVLWRLYPPKEWLEEAERAAEVKLPPETPYRTKTELALEVIDQALAWGLPPLPVGADSYYGDDYSFRQSLRERHLPYAVQVESHTVVWTEDPNHIALPPPRKTGRPRRYPPLAALPRPPSLQAGAGRLPGSAGGAGAVVEGRRGG